MLLCVILPVYNAEHYLTECLDSLFQQSFTDFIVLAINDASSDNSGKILEHYAQSENRLKVIHFTENKKEPFVSYFAIQQCLALPVDYVARMDADDICYPHRFETQIQFLDTHPHIDILGSNVMHFGETAQNISSRVPLSDDLIKANLLIARANILNPTVMWRKSSMQSVQLPNPQQILTAYDYALWVECALAHKTFANLDDVLVNYRLHPKQLSNKAQHVAQAVQITLAKWIQHLFPELNIEQVHSLTNICNGIQVSLSLDEFRQAIDSFQYIQPRASLYGENRDKIMSILNEKVTAIQKLLAQYDV